jgi:hypothetical protein
MKAGDFGEVPQLIYDPATTGSTAPFTRQPFMYNGKLNQIDPSRISPLAKYIYSILPMPNIPGVNPLIGNNYSAPNPLIQDQYTWGARFDHRFTDRDLVYGRITKAMSSNYRPGSGGIPTLDGFELAQRYLSE